MNRVENIDFLLWDSDQVLIKLNDGSVFKLEKEKDAYEDYSYIVRSYVITDYDLFKVEKIDEKEFNERVKVQRTRSDLINKEHRLGLYNQLKKEFEGK